MLTRHMNELMTRLERVADIGCAEIRTNELLLWYGRDRITKTVWSDVQEKWTEVGDNSPLLVGSSDGRWVLGYGKGLKTSEDSWFKDVRKLAGISFDDVNPLDEAA